MKTYTYIKYELSMPNVGSWNGRWTGENRYHVVVRRYKTRDENTQKILNCKYCDYNFGDGWCARISIGEVENSVEAKRENKKSLGFYGYEWMIDSIEKNGEILKPTRR